ncbi:energy transducer TonB [Lutibacter sp.]
MSTKKHPKANLENYSKLFVQLGLVLALSIVYALLENKTFEKNNTILSNVALINNFDIEQNIELKIKQPKEQPIQKKPILSVIEKIDNNMDTEETFLGDMGIDEPVEEPQFIDVNPIESPTIIDEVPFAIIEDAPIYPGCKGSKEQLKACLQKKITKHVNRKFNADLASDLGLLPGVKRIFVMFKIDKNGYITNIQARAPHKKLQEEAIRIVKLLPKMKPGMQRKKPVGVKYSLPIAFKVE